MEKFISDTKPLFSANITPHRSLSVRGFKFFMAFFLIYCLGFGIFFLSLGWWPVFAFLGLDVLALWWAFRISYLRGNRLEKIILLNDRLIIEKQNHKGAAEKWQFQPSWARMAYQKGLEEGQLDDL